MEIRLNIFDENNKWVGQEYLTEKGKWLHRWAHKGKLEKGSWRGRAKGDNELNWRYECVKDECSSVPQANDIIPLVSNSVCYKPDHVICCLKQNNLCTEDVPDCEYRQPDC